MKQPYDKETLMQMRVIEIEKQLNALKQNHTSLSEMVYAQRASRDNEIKVYHQKLTAHKNEIATLMEAHQDHVAKQLKGKSSLRDFLNTWLK